MLSAWLLSPVNKNVFVGSAQASLDRCLGPNKRLPWCSKTEAAQFQTGEIKIAAILQRKPRGELHPGEGEEGNQLTIEACALLCSQVATLSHTVLVFADPLKIILSVA